MESPIQPIQSPIQKILFGSPGTGKSWRIKKEIIPGLGIRGSNNPNIIRTVFHPEYTYGDFMGKLVPLTRSGKVEYNYYEGHFLKALGQAYKNIHKTHPTGNVKNIEWNKVDNVVLVIEEINRGNSAAIFGVCFQLLDRIQSLDKKTEASSENTTGTGEKNLENQDDEYGIGWSDYPVNLTSIEFQKLIELVGVTTGSFPHGVNKEPIIKYQFPGETHYVFFETLEEKFKPLGIDIKTQQIRLPPNLSILASMNTSDNSIYFMDSAFKRRWDWEFVNWDDDTYDDDTQPPDAKDGELNRKQWKKLIKNLNEFIKKHHASIRGIEDKQIGYYFIKPPVTADKIQNKLMFFLWDSVFNRDKEPLVKLLGVTKNDLVTFGDFTKLHNEFITKINAGEWRKTP